MFKQIWLQFQTLMSLETEQSAYNLVPHFFEWVKLHLFQDQVINSSILPWSFMAMWLILIYFEFRVFTQLWPLKKKTKPQLITTNSL